MPAASLNHIQELVLGLLIVVAALAALAKRVSIPYPIIMVIGGLVLGLTPGLPRIPLNPNLIFYVVLPPLIFSAAFQISWREFRNNAVAILMLAFGLVGFTVYAVAAFSRWALPGFDWRLGLVLGAVVAPTDPLSATATARRLGIPRKITDLLEAESLVNDGSGLVALNFTAGLVVSGATPTFLGGTGELLYIITVAVAIGLAVGFLVHQVQQHISDAPIEITLSLITPYVAYLAADLLHCSGILATLACGLYLGRRSSGFYSLHARLESRAVWRTLDFVLNGVVFLLLGLQLPVIMSDIRGIGLGGLLWRATLFSAAVILIRLIWVYPGAWISGLIRSGLHMRQPAFSKREIFVVGWSGMRGVLGLAAALSLPETLRNGARFPERNVIIFLTFCAIFATLVLQGLSLPAIIRKLGVGGAEGLGDEETAARREMVQAALDEIGRIRDEQGGELTEVEQQMERYYRQRLAQLRRDGDEDGDQSIAPASEYEKIGRRLRSIERSVALKLRDEAKIHDEVLRSLEHELDLLDARFAEMD